MKEKGFTLINTIGLAMGLACFILIMVYVIHEHSYEKFRPDHERMYRLYLHGSLNSNSQEPNEGFLPDPLPTYIKQNFPEVEQVAAFDLTGGIVVTYKDVYFQEWRALLGDTNFLKMFPAEFIAGDSKQALIGSHKIVLTETSAKKWFGNENPMGKLMKVAGDTVFFEVTGIVKDPRTDTHVKYSMLISDISYPAGIPDSWIQSRFRYVYVRLKEHVDPEQFVQKLQPLITEKIEPEIVKLTGKKLLEFTGGTKLPSFMIQKIDDIHLDSRIMMDVGGVTGSKIMVTICSIIALAILLLACINFINLSTARFANRMKEICVKKTVGSSRASLFMQYNAESYLLTFSAIILALALVELFIKPFCDNMLLEYIISIYKVKYFFPFIIAVFLIVGFISGAYPAFIMSATNITEGLKGKFIASKKGTFLRKSLVVAQFAVSFIILLGAIVIGQQLKYIMADNKGFSRQDLTVLHGVGTIDKDKRIPLKEEILKIPGVKNACFSNLYIGTYVNEFNFWKEDDSTQTPITLMSNSVDQDYIPTMKLTLMKGRNFIKDNEKDSLTIIINETAARRLGYENPIGKQLVTISGNPNEPTVKVTIIGEVKDFNIQTIYSEIQPLVIFFGRTNFQYIIVKVSPEDKQRVNAMIKTKWKEFSGGNNPFSEELQATIDWTYRTEISARKLVTTFSLICIIIACMGLIGLVSYSTLRRTKEIGIRKANGASVFQIVFALSKETIVLIAIAIAIALPVGYIAISGWLGQYAYHVELSIGTFILAIISLYVIALCSEMVLTVKAACQNPVKALRYE